MSYFLLSDFYLIALIRAIIRKPKYILLENFFEDLDENYINLATNILKDAEQFSTIIACEKDFNEVFQDFKIINL